MLILLITGPGTSGKSTFRRKFVRRLKENDRIVYHYDADGFGSQIRHPDDAGEKIIPLCYAKDDPFTVYVIEDVRGLSEGCFRPLSCYDGIIYVQPRSLLDHVKMILSRAHRWYELGKFDWTRESGWKGNGKENDWRNLWPIMKIVARRIPALRKRIKLDRIAIEASGKPCRFVTSRYNDVYGGVSFEESGY